jgi:hypothetical protein
MLSAVTTTETWKSVFTGWPEGIARRGLLVNALNETVPFKAFMIKGDLLMLDRTNPDPAGTRYVLMSFDDIRLLKFVDQLKEAVLKADGYQGNLA